MPYFINANCIGITDMACVDECPVDCIYEGKGKLYINPVECIDCGACEAVCPQDAITSTRTAGADQRIWIDDNARFFSTPLPGRAEALGNPGGASTIDPTDVDTELVQSYLDS